jgi:hypothetical protein
MQLWTTVTTVLSDLLALAGGVAALMAAVRANRRPPRGRRHRRKG